MSVHCIDVIEVPFTEQQEGQQVGDGGVGSLWVGALIHGLQG